MSAKPFFCILFLVLINPSLLTAQNLPTTTPSNIVGNQFVTPPTNFYAFPNISPTTFNFVRTFVPLEPMTSIGTYSSTLNQPIQVSTTYFDSRGEMIMTVGRNQSGKDVVTPHFNRSTKLIVDYLPYTVDPGSKFRQSMFTEQKNYYNSLFPGEGDFAYTKTRGWNDNGRPVIYEFTPGKTRVGTGHGVTKTSYTNLSGDVMRLTLSANGICSTGTYGNNQLWVRVTTNADGNVEKVYTDKSNRVVCKKVAKTSALNSWLSTYYVYNELGKVVAVVPPKASDLITSSNTCIADPSKLCFLYEYDGFGSMIRKRIPGKDDFDLTLYDSKNQAVLIQTPLLKTQSKWQFSLLDNVGRPVCSGLLTSTATEAYWRGILAGTQTPNNYLDANNQPVPTTQTLEYALTNSFTAYPTTLFNCDIQTYNYYDDYSTLPAPANTVSYSTAFNSEFLSGNAMVTPEPYYYTQGKLLATRTRIIDNGFTNNFSNTPWITSVFYYDEMGRVIQTQTLNPWNTTNWDIAINQYDFSGNTVLNIIRHNAWSSNNKPQTTIRTKNVFATTTGRLIRTQQSIDGSIWRTIATYTYDAFGKATRKLIGGVEEQNYTYNIRGQIIGVNASSPLQETVSTPMPANQTYKESLHYDDGFDDIHYNGSLAGYRWRTPSSHTYSYGYEYDAVGRMTRADFREWSPDTLSSYTVQWNKSKRDFSTYDLTYDANGNIGTMRQWGYNSVMAKGQIDNLTYNYEAGTNKLLKVDENGATAPAVDDFKGSAGTSIDYSYDADGNLASDLNKGLSSLSYNFQDLPQTVVKGNGYIRNIYDAGGTLLQKQIKENNNSTVTTYRYWGPFVYKNDVLDYIVQPEGRARYLPDSGGIMKYDYYVKDHLGNVRTVVTSDEYSLSRDYLATHEVASANLEESIFQNIAEVRDVRPEGTPYDLRSAMLDGSDSVKRIGTALVLKVMAGDKINLGGWAWHHGKNSEEDTYTRPEAMVGSIVSVLSGGMGGFDGGEEGNGARIVENMFSGQNYIDAYEGIKTPNTNANNPRSFLNYLVFDREMQLNPSQSGAIQVSGAAESWDYKSLPSDLVMERSGYIAVYISNEDLVPVWWDNINIVHTKGRLQEENHYYPHGGLYTHNTPDPGLPKDQFAHQGKKLQDELTMCLYDFGPRQYDPQLGRFWGLDALDQYPSGYTGMGNDPANMIDPSGLWAQNLAGVEHATIRNRWRAIQDINAKSRYHKAVAEYVAEVKAARDAELQAMIKSEVPPQGDGNDMRGDGWGGSMPGTAMSVDDFIKYNDQRAAAKAAEERENNPNNSLTAAAYGGTQATMDKFAAGMTEAMCKFNVDQQVNGDQFTPLFAEPSYNDIAMLNPNNGPLLADGGASLSAAAIYAMTFQGAGATIEIPPLAIGIGIAGIAIGTGVYLYNHYGQDHHYGIPDPTKPSNQPANFRKQQPDDLPDGRDVAFRWLGVGAFGGLGAYMFYDNIKSSMPNVPKQDKTRVFRQAIPTNVKPYWAK